jgi:hypothetical protein
LFTFGFGKDYYKHFANAVVTYKNLIQYRRTKAKFKKEDENEDVKFFLGGVPSFSQSVRTSIFGS